MGWPPERQGWRRPHGQLRAPIRGNQIRAFPRNSATSTASPGHDLDEMVRGGALRSAGSGPCHVATPSYLAGVAGGYEYGDGFVSVPGDGTGRGRCILDVATETSVPFGARPRFRPCNGAIN